MYRVKSQFYTMPIRYLIGPCFSLLVLFSLPMLAWQLDKVGLNIQNHYREVKLEHARWQRYKKLLLNAPMAQLTGSIDQVSFEVALHEAALSLQTQPEVQIDVFTVAPADLLDVDDELGIPIQPIRIGFEATLLHAPALLSILGRLVEVADWRATEVRGCAMQRLASEIRIATACTIDIYHWSWTANTDTEIN